MRMRWLVVVVAACGRTTPAPVAPPPVTAAPSEPGCADAAAGLERATVDVRAPGASVWKAMHEHCLGDEWSAAAIECFTHMQSEQLVACAKLLGDAARGQLFGVLRGEHDTIAVARARLQTVQVGVEECDRFVAAVTSLLDCEQMPVDDRVRLGNEIAELWDLPTHGLPASAQQRMAETCGAQLAQLQADAQSHGCVR
jgi:hypothetical protein